MLHEQRIYIYREVIDRTKSYKLKHCGSQPMFFTPDERESTRFAFFQLIITFIMPIPIVSDQVYRSFCKYEEKFGRQYVTEVMFALIAIEEKKIAYQMPQARGAILHDGGPSGGYIPLVFSLLSYIKMVTLTVFEHR